MFVFPCVNVESTSVCLVSDTVSNFASEDETTALHMVVHDILKDRSELFVVDEIEVNLFIGCDVYSDISFNEV